MKTNKYPTKWNFKLLLGKEGEKGLDKISQKAQEESAKFVGKWKDRTDYLEKPEALKEALDDFEYWARNYSADNTANNYYSLRLAQNQNDTKLKAKANLAQDRAIKIINDIQFFSLRLGKASDDKQKEFLESPLLAPYHHFLEQLFATAKYNLSEPEEKILNLESQSAYGAWVQMTSGFIAKEERELKVGGKKIKKNLEEILTLASHEKKAIRDQAAAAFNDILAKYVEVAEAEMNAILGSKKVTDELRGLSRPDLPRHLSDDIDTEIVDIMLAEVSGKNSIANRFYALKAKLLGQKKLAYHERTVPIGQADKEISYGESVALVKKVFTNLDPEFRTIYERFLRDGQFDVFPVKNKSGGAFCASGLLTHPTYILLNYTNRLSDALTIAHEVGHGINNELQRKKQNELNFSVPLSTAEVASTFMEDFVLKEVVREETSEKKKLAIAMMKLNSDISTIFRQVACYRFEQELHKTFRAKGYLSKDEIGKLFLAEMKKYMGPAVSQSPGAENWWVYWSHIRNFFYVYSYASGLLISKALQNKVKKDPAFIAEVKEFLSAGSSASPKDIFAKMGIDITDRHFWRAGLAEIDEQLTQAEKLAKKLKYKI